MPIYEYITEECRLAPPCAGRRAFLQGINDAPKQACPECGAPLKRVLSSFATGGERRDQRAEGGGTQRSSQPGPTSPAGSTTSKGEAAPPPTMKNIFGGGLGISGCGH